jgi:hypothetical protein
MNVSGKILLFILILSGVPAPRSGATVYHSNGSAASVQYLHDFSAQNGDTITLPPGTFSWLTGVNITKNITLQGAGINATTVVSDSIFQVSLGTSSSTVTGIHFVLFGATSAGAMIYASGQNFRVHDNKLENGGSYPSRSAVLCAGSSSAGIPHPTGVIDHNTFLNSKVLIQGDLNLIAQNIWHEPSKIGNPDQTGVVYIEDNYFDADNDIGADVADADYGGRYVFRYNEAHNRQVEIHSTRLNMRGGKSAEVYNNVFIRDIPGDGFTGIWFRNGTGVIYNNTFTGIWDNAVVFDNVRSFTVFAYPGGVCDGTSDWDGNATNGWPCRDQVGRGSDSYLWTVAPYPSQPSEPVYVWNNTLNGSPAPVFITNCNSTVKPNGSCADVAAGRDYILGARPNYRPYAYPYPLVGPHPRNSDLVSR